MHVPEPEIHRFRFTGSGEEYFKIWIVSLLLSIVTIGIYTPWARARRLQYFHRNTQLAGAAFDFSGNPLAMFGRLMLAVFLAAACIAASRFSTAAGTVLFLLVLLVVPFLLREAARCRSRSTRYRGVPFEFKGTIAGAYAAYLPPLSIFLVPAVIATMEPPVQILLLFIPYCLAWPLMRHAMTRYRHGHLQWGSMDFSFDAAKLGFYLPYLTSLALLLLMLANAFSILLLAAVASSTFGGSIYEANLRSHATLSIGLLAAFIMYLCAGPYLQARIGNLAWCATALPGVRIASHMKPGGYLKLQLANAILTLLSLGLHRPFAAVRAYRHRIEHVAVTTDGGVESTRAAVAQGNARPIAERPHQHWYAALLALFLLAAVAVSFVQWGMPALAGRIVASLPAPIDQRVGDAAEHAMTASGLLRAPTIPSEKVLAEVQQIYETIRPANARVPMRLLVHGMHPHEPHAFSLPNGTIVISDDMLIGLQYGDEGSKIDTRASIAAVIAHEIGHLEGRHAMRAILDSSILALASAALTGDFSTAVAADPLLLLRMRYPRAMEAAADDYAVERMRQAGLPMAPLAGLYDALSQSVPREERDIPPWMAVRFNYMHSHPPSAARLRSERQFRASLPAIGR